MLPAAQPRTSKPYSPNFIDRLVKLVESTMRANIALESLQISNLGQFSLSPMFMKEVYSSKGATGDSDNVNYRKVGRNQIIASEKKKNAAALLVHESRS